MASDTSSRQSLTDSSAWPALESSYLESNSDSEKHSTRLSKRRSQSSQSQPAASPLYSSQAEPRPKYTLSSSNSEFSQTDRNSIDINSSQKHSLYKHCVSTGSTDTPQSASQHVKIQINTRNINTKELPQDITSPGGRRYSSVHTTTTLPAPLGNSSISPIFATSTAYNPTYTQLQTPEHQIAKRESHSWFSSQNSNQNSVKYVNSTTSLSSPTSFKQRRLSAPSQPLIHTQRTNRAARTRVRSLPSSEIKSYQRHGNSLSSSSNDSAAPSVSGSEASDLTKLIISVPALDLQNNNSRSIINTYTGSNKPLFDTPLPKAPNSSFNSSNSSNSSTSSTSNSSSNSPSLRGPGIQTSAPIIASSVSPVSPIPTRPVSLTLPYNQSFDNILKNKDNRYSCTEIILMEERLKSGDFSSPIQPTRSDANLSTSSFTAAPKPARYHTSRQAHSSPESDDNLPPPKNTLGQSAWKIPKSHSGSELYKTMTTTTRNPLIIFKKDDIAGPSSATQNHNQTQNQQQQLQQASQSKKFSFPWRKKKPKAYEPVSLPLASQSTAPVLDLPLSFEAGRSDLDLLHMVSGEQLSPTKQQQPVDAASSTLVFSSPSNASKSAEVTPKNSGMPMIPVDKKFVRKSLSYELDSEVERASQDNLRQSRKDKDKVSVFCICVFPL